MNSQQLELALRKQRLLLRSAELREALVQQSATFAPIGSLFDRLSDGARWLGARPHLIALATAILVIVKPRAVWRWGRRAFFAWRLWQRTSEFVHTHLGKGIFARWL